MRINWITIPIVLLAFSAADAQNFMQIQKTGSGESTVDYIRRHIVVTGRGASNPMHKSLAEKKLWALTEARKNCINQAAVAVSGLTVESTTFMNAGILKGTNVSLMIEDYVRGIKDLKEHTETLQDGSVLATVSMVIEFDGNEGLNKLLFNTLFPPDEISQFNTENNSNRKKVNRKITGFVFDVKGLKIRPSMNPEIYSETGDLIYGPGKMSREYAVRYGIVGYTRDIKNVSERIGDNPVLVDVLELKPGDNSSIIITKKDAERILDIDRREGILKSCQVAFLIQ